MFGKMKDFAEKAKDSIGEFANREDVRIAAEQVKKTAATMGSEAARLGKEAAKSDFAKDAGAGAAVGAVMGVPIPIIGPIAGATVGATLGIYKNLTRSGQPSNESTSNQKTQVDLYSEMLKLDDLRQKGILSDDEFSSMKENLLKSNA